MALALAVLAVSAAAAAAAVVAATVAAVARIGAEVAEKLSRRNIETGGKGGETSRQCVAMAWAARSVPVTIASTPASDCYNCCG